MKNKISSWADKTMSLKGWKCDKSRLVIFYVRASYINMQFILDSTVLQLLWQNTLSTLRSMISVLDFIYDAGLQKKIVDSHLKEKLFPLMRFEGRL